MPFSALLRMLKIGKIEVKYGCGEDGGLAVKVEGRRTSYLVGRAWLWSEGRRKEDSTVWQVATSCVGRWVPLTIAYLALCR